MFYLGGLDTDEPYTDLATVITLTQFLEYFDLEELEGAEDTEDF